MSTSEALWPDEAFADLDRDGPLPLYHQVSTRLEHAIRSGDLPPGARVENEIAIAQRLGMSRPTVRRAIQELVDKGLLVRRRGVGTQVVQGRVARPVELTSLFEDLQSTQHEPGTRVLERRLDVADDDVAEALGIAVGSTVLRLRRLRSTDGVDVAVLENVLPEAYADVTAEQLEERGLYQILRGRGVSFRVARQTIGARRARGDEGALLGIDADGPVLTMERIAFDGAGSAIELGRHCYHPDRYTFETTLVAR